MIDTVHFTLQTRLDEEILFSQWTNEVTRYPKGDTYISFTLGQRNRKKHNIYLKYSYRFDDGKVIKPKLSVEINSVPKLYRKDNLTMPSNIDLIIMIINDELRSRPGLSKIDVSKGTLERIDFFYDYPVNRYVKDYISVISTLEYPHRDRNIFKNNLRFGSNKKYQGNGVTFFSEAEHTTFYDKKQQSGLEIANGRLRHEKRLTKTSAIRNVIHITSLSEVNWQITRKALQDDLDILGLNNPIESPSKALTKLIKTGTQKETNTFFHYLFFRQYKGLVNKELAQLLDKDQDTIRRWRKDLEDKGFCPGFLENDKLSLPRLELPEELPPILTQIRALNRKQQKAKKINADLAAKESNTSSNNNR